MASGIPYLEECFGGSLMESTEFVRYLGVLRRASKSRSDFFPEKHHIVPREWLKLNVPGFGSKTEDPRNVLWLTVERKFFAMQLLVAMFLLKKDSRMYEALVSSMARRYGYQFCDLWSDPYVSKEGREEGIAYRKAALLGRSHKYSDSYLRKCLEIWRSSDDKDFAFGEIRRKMLFRNTKAALMYQFRERLAEEP